MNKELYQTEKISSTRKILEEDTFFKQGTFIFLNHSNDFETESEA